MDRNMWFDVFFLFFVMGVLSAINIRTGMGVDISGEDITQCVFLCDVNSEVSSIDAAGHCVCGNGAIFNF